MNAAVEFRNVDIVFGEARAEALAMIDRGATRAEILEKTGAVLGCARANLTVNEGEISVLMGLSGSGKSTLLRAVNRLNVPARGNVFVHDGDRTVDEADAHPGIALGAGHQWGQVHHIKRVAHAFLAEGREPGRRDGQSRR